MADVVLDKLVKRYDDVEAVRSIDLDIAAIFDPYGNAVHTALSFDLIGEDVLVTGAGPIGIMATAICRHVGARHVVITDVNMPNMDGITLIRQLRTLPSYKFTPILMLTTESGADKKQQGKAAGATNLPLYITQDRAVTVFLLTLAMCAISGLLAVRKVRRLDPAEVF